MSTCLRDAFTRVRAELRYEPTEKRVRAMLFDHTVADSTAAALVWEPRRVVPCYAVPVEDLDAELLPSSAPPPGDEGAVDAPLLPTGFAFGVHFTQGEALDLRVDGERREGSAFRPANSDPSGYVVLDFHAFDGWHEEDEPIFAQDPEISRQHGRISRAADGSFAVEDLGSTNGTVVNGRLIEGPEQLSIGDEVEVGGTKLLVREITQPTVPVAPEPAAAPAEPAVDTGKTALRPVPGHDPAPADARSDQRAPLPALELTLRLDVDKRGPHIGIGDGDELRVVLRDGRWIAPPAAG